MVSGWHAEIACLSVTNGPESIFYIFLYIKNVRYFFGEMGLAVLAGTQTRVAAFSSWAIKNEFKNAKFTLLSLLELNMGPTISGCCLFN